MRRALAPWLAAVTLAGAGCGLIPNDPPVDPGPVELVHDCEPPLAFDGDATIAELGLADDLPNIGDHAAVRGRIRITHDTITHDQFAPPGMPVFVPEGQLLCLTFPDGGGMTTMLPVRFPDEPDAAGQEGGRGDLPVVPMVAGLVLALMAGVSWVAFRRDSGASDG